MPPIELTLLNALCQLAGRIGWSSATYPSLCEVRGEISSSSRSYHCFHRRSLAPSFLDMTSSPLPSPLTSLTPPTTATTRIRIKPPRRPGSLSIPRTRSMSAPTVVTTDPDTPASDIRSNALAGAVGRRQSHKSPITPSSPSPSSRRSQSYRTLLSGLDGVADGKENVSKRSSLALGSCSPSTRES